MNDQLIPIAKLKFKSGVPHGGMFSLNLPQQGIVGKGTSFSSLCREVRNWRKANAWPIGLGLTDEIEQAVCRSYPNECQIHDDRVPDRNRRYSITHVMQGTINMVRHKLNGSVLVDEAEAERRAAICANCPNNVSFSKPCSSNCPELKDLIQALVGSKKTSKDSLLKSCQICGCFLGISVWVPLEVQNKSLTDRQKMQFEYANQTVGCWKSIS